jgi:pSer/pThr/pTyr-binding forkhead associated (FHA) protein
VASVDSPTEKASLISAERRAAPFIVYHDMRNKQRIYELPERGQVTIGRGSWMDISINWDEAASRLHARLESLGDDWTVVDDGTSRNGTFLNEERVEGRKRLDDGDVLMIGSTALRICMPGRLDEGSTVVFEREELADKLRDADGEGPGPA